MYVEKKLPDKIRHKPRQIISERFFILANLSKFKKIFSDDILLKRRKSLYLNMAMKVIYK